jgi:mannitol-specific phosphotransferase system IIBC component
VTGTAEELDSELSSTIVGFVGSHLQMKNDLEKAKAKRDAASRAAQAEARAKSKTAGKKKPSKNGNQTACRNHQVRRACEARVGEDRELLRSTGAGGYPLSRNIRS